MPITKTSRTRAKTSIITVLAFIIVFLFIVNAKLPFENNEANAASYGADKYFQISQQYITKKQYEAADNALTIGIKNYPGAARLYYHRATIRADFLKMPQDAIADYTRVIKINDKSCAECMKANCYRGWTFYRIGQYANAIEDFNRSLVVMPKYKKVYLYRAKAYGKIGMVNEATRDCFLYKKAFPGSAKAAEYVLQKLLSGNTDFD